MNPIASFPLQNATIGGHMNHSLKESAEGPGGARSSENQGQSFILGLWGVRYQVKDVCRSVAFYTQQLGFKLDHEVLPAFAHVPSVISN